MRLDCKVSSNSSSTTSNSHFHLTNLSTVPRSFWQLHDENVLDEITIVCWSRASVTWSLWWCIEGDFAQRWNWFHDRRLIDQATNETRSGLHRWIAGLLQAKSENWITWWVFFLRCFFAEYQTKTFQEFKIANATSRRVAKTGVKFCAATTATSAASLSASPTVNVDSFGVAMSCAVRAQKSEKFTLADDFFADTSRTIIVYVEDSLLSLYNLQISFVSENSSC